MLSSAKPTIVKTVKVELVVVLAMVLLLGILFGYSLAKGAITVEPGATTMGESFSSDGLR